MENMVRSFKELTPELQAYAGGKGSMLAKMYQSGYPVPDGFVILPSAFENEKLNDKAWKEIQALLNEIRSNNQGAMFAVRSSGLSEDSAQASFAGEFESVLNVNTDIEIQKAIDTVFKSKESERVKAYSSVQGMDHSHKIAVVIQLMVQSEISGVLFTADPITGSYESMIGNYVFGLGEQLVSGEANAYDFKLLRPKGKYEGPEDFKKYASSLYKYAAKLSDELGCEQDIEWAVAKGKLYILQARPITTLSFGNLDTYEINESLTGDALWVNTNVGEAIPDVVTPLTWSIVRDLDEESSFVPGYYLWSGNICGRIYSNISQRISAVSALYGTGPEFVMRVIGESFGRIPEEINIPTYPFSRLKLIKLMIPRIIQYSRKTMKTSKEIPQFIKDTPDWCVRMTEQVKKAKSKEELLLLWKNHIEPQNTKAWWGLLVGGSKAGLTLTPINKKLTEMVGSEDASTLLSNLRGNSDLQSLGPVVGISNVIKGDMSREEYLKQYGHRGPHEFELSIPDPGEDKSWLDKQIEEYKKSDTDVEGLLKKQHIQYEDALKKFQKQFPSKIKWFEKKIEKAAENARVREAVRSEFVRVFRVIRVFALKTGELTGIGDDVFLLYINEVINLLSGDKSAVKFIPARKENYEKYKSLPPFPSLISGRFNPLEWVNDPNRRMDYYDSNMPIDVASDGETLKGFPGAAGRIEGKVRILMNPEDGDMLEPGEILVATTTNVGWTPLFPRAAAVITDVGAPLSHAAIVARELGIPAVVGCGNATLRLKTGDKVVVDGGQGIIWVTDIDE
ncbi:PEP/pyruvate-binding domain-containing protein [Sedimentibacter sp. MB31-C6]|uniref:PEP/pyruvate-binding domain-containing protein n=1 Tax=Sedimentibacter sp. MB31-C6 TaxID=3109366 RepID=UPI002DDCD568|nr:PEP/pyruvate-binding domain-containing protein [Sedimentibacter sp. MB36-C1]WSI04645.1 PEP/pyruvate-binding domain-containing protein [Sedimentibacter sp. MB36-C1]